MSTAVTDQEEAYLRALRTGASHAAAASETVYSLSWWKNHRKTHPEFEERVDQAYDEGSDALEDEAKRRAVHGVEEGVYYKGERVDTVRKYSDVLLIFLLKARRPEKFRERSEVAHTGPEGLAERMQEGRQRLAAERAGDKGGDSFLD